ncbi:hypothetical protein M426DRAFT_161391 [Hypoxylon sp. CI-4A]|nr:hypothetical protein M426DRAFT_161391 [Hypoxylon sp. CI-4A]
MFWRHGNAFVTHSIPSSNFTITYHVLSFAVVVIGTCTQIINIRTYIHRYYTYSNVCMLAIFRRSTYTTTVEASIDHCRTTCCIVYVVWCTWMGN